MNLDKWKYLREDTLTVKEFIEKLQKYPEDAIVVYYEAESDTGEDASGLTPLCDPDFDKEHHAVIF